MQNHYLPSNPVTLTRSLMPEQHIGMMNVYVRMDLGLRSGQKDELDDKQVHNVAVVPITAWEEMQGARNGKG